MRRRCLLLPALLAVLATGCDTGANEDVERLVGEWNATTVNTRALGLTLPVLDLSDQEPASTLDLTADARFSMTLRLPDALTVGPSGSTVSVPLPDEVRLAGTYTADVAARTLTVTPAPPAPPLTFGYAFRGSRDLELIATDDGTFAALIGVAAGPSYEALARLVDGGSIRFSPR